VKTSGRSQPQEAPTPSGAVRGLDRSGARRRPGSPESRRFVETFTDADAAVVGIVIERNGAIETLYWACDIPRRSDGARSIWLPLHLAQSMSVRRAEQVARAIPFELARKAIENVGARLVGTLFVTNYPAT
jgi:hypothetical protein